MNIVNDFNRFSCFLLDRFVSIVLKIKINLKKYHMKKTVILSLALAISSMLYVSTQAVAQHYRLDTVKVKGLVRWLEGFKLTNHQAGHNALEGDIPVMVAFQDLTYGPKTPNAHVQWGMNIGTKSMDHPFKKIELILNFPTCKSIILNIADECLPLKENAPKELQDAKRVVEFLATCGIFLDWSELLGKKYLPLEDTQSADGKEKK
jgi:hypothetical protein